MDEFHNLVNIVQPVQVINCGGGLFDIEQSRCIHIWEYFLCVFYKFLIDKDNLCRNSYRFNLVFEILWNRVDQIHIRYKTVKIADELVTLGTRSNVRTTQNRTIPDQTRHTMHHIRPHYAPHKTRPNHTAPDQTTLNTSHGAQCIRPNYTPTDQA